MFVVNQPGKRKPERFVAAARTDEKDLMLVYIPEDRTIGSAHRLPIFAEHYLGKPAQRREECRGGRGDHGYLPVSDPHRGRLDFPDEIREVIFGLAPVPEEPGSLASCPPALFPSRISTRL